LYPGIRKTARRTENSSDEREEHPVRYEFERDGRTVASVLWEGPGQVTMDVADPADRPLIDRFFGSEVVYLSAGIDFGGAEEELTTRRRDWTPWEFERSCRNLAHRMGCTVRRVETGPVEDRPEEVAAR